MHVYVHVCTNHATVSQLAGDASEANDKCLLRTKGGREQERQRESECVCVRETDRERL